MGCVSSTLTYRTEIGFRVILRPIFFCFWRLFGEIIDIRPGKRRRHNKITCFGTNKGMGSPMLLFLRNLIRIPGNVSSTIFPHRPLKPLFIIIPVKPIIDSPSFVLKDKMHCESETNRLIWRPLRDAYGNLHISLPILHFPNLKMD